MTPTSPAGGNRSRKSSTLSMDVMDAANRVHWESAACHNSTRSLLSTIREKADLQSSTFAQRVFEAGKSDLLYDLRTTSRLKDHIYGVLDLTALGRMNEHVLQQKLVEQVKAIGEKRAWMDIGIQQTLHDYCKFSIFVD